MALVNTDDGLLTQGFFKTKFWGKLLGMLSGKSGTSHTHSVKINGTTKTIPATGDTAVDLGTYLTSHQDISGKLDTTGNASNTTSTFTKASGDTSSMTSGGKLSVIFTAISSFFASLKALAFKDKASYNDLSSGVQSSLDKADSALQSHQSVTDNNPTLAWGATSKVGKVGSTDLQVTMPNLDTAMSDSSDNAVKNKVVDAALKAISRLWREIIGETAVDLNSLYASEGQLKLYKWVYANAGNVSNKPVAGGGELVVLSYGNNSVMQLCMDGSDGTKCYVRQKNSSGWTDWLDIRSASWINSGTFGTDRIADDAITAAKVKDNETLPVNVSGSASQLSHVTSQNEASTWRQIAKLESSDANRVLAQGFVVAIRERINDGAYYTGTYIVSCTSKGSDCKILQGTRRADAYEMEFVVAVDSNSITLYAHSSSYSPYHVTALFGNPTIAIGSSLGSKPAGTDVAKTFLLDTIGQVGSPTTPVYVDSNGQVQPCDPSQMGVGAASYASAAAAAASGSTLETKVNKGLAAYKETYTNVTLIQGNIYSKTIVLEIGQENSSGNGIRLFLNNNIGTFEVSIRTGTWNNWMDGGSVIWMLQASFGVGVNSPVTKINNDTKSLANLTTQTIGGVDIGGSPGQYPVNGTISGRFYFVNNAASGILTFEASFSTSQSTQYGGLNDTFVIGKAEWTSFADHKVTSILT